MTDRYPYRHHGPAVHGSKLTDYLISEANMIEDIEQLRAENARLKTALLHIKDGRGYCSCCGEIASGPMGGVLSCDCSAAGYHWEHDPVKIARAALSADPAPVVDGPDWEDDNG